MFKIGDTVKTAESDQVGTVEEIDEKVPANGRRYLVRWTKNYASKMQSRSLELVAPASETV